MKATAIALICLSICLSGCVSEKAVVQKNYVFELPDDIIAGTMDSVPYIRGICEIEQVQMSPVYEGTRIVNRSDSHEITYYKYHQWAVMPSLAITEIINHYMDNKQLFESVSSRFGSGIPDFRLATKIYQLEVIEMDDVFSAHVHLEFNLLTNISNSKLVQHRADRLEPLREKDLNLFAKTVSNIVFEELEKFSILVTEQYPDLMKNLH